MLPNLLIIGAMKCGTTSFRKYLSAHPEIYLPQSAEINYFAHDYKKDIKLYESHFRSHLKIIADNSPAYSMTHRYKGIAEKVHSILPESKIVYIVRKPVDRIFSHYMHRILTGVREGDSSSLSFSNLDNNHFVLTSKYFMHIEEYLKYFSDDKILLVKAEDLRDNKKKVLEEVFGFLDIDSSFWHKDYNITHHQTSMKGKKTFVGRFIYKLGISKRIKPYIPKNVETFYRSISERPYHKPYFPAELKENIITFLEDDITKLEFYTGWNLKNWRDI